MLVVVTGGTRGIGRAIVERFAKEGHTVIYTYRVSDKLAQQEDAQYPGVKGFKCDVRDERASRVLAERILSEYGNVAVLVNNAGITRDRSFVKMTYEEWREVLEVNLLGLFTFTQAFFKNMLENRFGRIVNISSVVGQKGAFGQANYAASKAGVIGFTKALAFEGAGKNVLVNAIAPGYIATEMVAQMPQNVLDAVIAQVPVKRLGGTDDIAELAYFLTSDAGQYITGQVLAPNGGLY